jgi:hypothetical protein
MLTLFLGMNPKEVSDKLKLDSVAKNHMWKVEPSCAVSGEGIFEGLVSIRMHSHVIAGATANWESRHGSRATSRHLRPSKCVATTCHASHSPLSPPLNLYPNIRPADVGRLADFEHLPQGRLYHDANPWRLIGSASLAVYLLSGYLVRLLAIRICNGGFLSEDSSVRGDAGPRSSIAGTVFYLFRCTVLFNIDEEDWYDSMYSGIFSGIAKPG